MIGLGAAFEHTPQGLVVTAIYPGGAIFVANENQLEDSARVMPQDRLTHIGGVPLGGKDKTKAGDLLLGQPGTLVDLQFEKIPIRRSDRPEAFSIQVTRQSSLKARSQAWRAEEGSATSPQNIDVGGGGGRMEANSPGKDGYYLGSHSPAKSLRSTSPPPAGGGSGGPNAASAYHNHNHIHPKVGAHPAQTTASPPSPESRVPSSNPPPKPPNASLARRRGRCTSRRARSCCTRC